MQKCKVCGGKLKKNGFTKSGKQRWRCCECNASSTIRNDTASRWLSIFIKWILGKLSQAELKISARTFRRYTSKFWKLWPILPVCDEVHHVVYMDGIWLVRNKAVLLIACTDNHIIGCHVAISENSKDWGCLMQRIAPPDVLVCDGMGGIEKAMKIYWPTTRLQRCTFHAYKQVQRCTTYRPNLQAGVDLLGIAKALMDVKTLDEAAEWLASFSNWCSEWNEFLKEKTIVDGKDQFKHERLRRARRGLEKLCNSGTLFTYLDEELVKGGYVSPMSNKIESANARLREVFRNHRGLNIDHRIKAGFWWCYMNSEAPATPKQMLEIFPDDKQLMEWRKEAAKHDTEDCEVARWGTGVVWAEFHHSTPYPYWID